ncbi:hypothetical protein pEaSNUABM54_00028 [Erwinia phage pEa_SNUABM_54]|nr:hypothetical protein pEaSNUABM54_00028 [Erwinia phage pEa_SNUABM_54]
MDTKLVLFKCIMLLYWESRVQNPVDNSASLVKEILGRMKNIDNGFGTESSTDALNGMKSTAAWMTEQSHTHTYDKTSLLQRLRVNVSAEEGLFTAIEEGLGLEETPETIKAQCSEHRNDLYAYKEREDIKGVVKKYSSRLAFEEESIDWASFMSEFKGELEPFTGQRFEAADAAIVDEINTSDVSTLTDAIRRGLEESGADGIMQTRWQGLNRMMGEYGGFRRGDFIVVGALQHNFKTGFTLDLTRQIAMNATPYMRDPTKKPMILHISTENSVKDNVIQLYVTLKAQETGQKLEITQLAEDAKNNPEFYAEIASYVKVHLERTGYTVTMLRVNPSMFNYQKLFNLLNKYESQGYEIHLLTIDYLNMMSKEGCVTGATGTDVRDLFRRVRNYCNPRGITVITPHQISSEAKNLLRNGTESFVKEIANKGYWDGCRVIDQEVDLELLIHIEKVDGESFLTIQRGKHRKVGITKEEDLYCVYKFHPALGIPEDVGGPDMSRRKVGGNANSQGGGNGWMDFAA